MSSVERYNIMIVDQDEATRCTLADLLRDRDEYRVLVAGDGDEAVKMFVEESRIDIVLTDIHMPGFDCLELMSDMLRLKHRPEILIMTSNGSAEVIQQARQIGARSIILKPFEHLDLIEAEVEKAVQALFEARARGSSGTMSPPAAKREAAAPVPVTEAPPAPGPPASIPAPEARRGASQVETRQSSGRPAASIDPAGQGPFVGNETPQPALRKPATTPVAAGATPATVAGTPGMPTTASEAPDAGSTMRIDRPEFAIASARPGATPAPARTPPKPQAAPLAATRPSVASAPAAVSGTGSGPPGASPGPEQMKGRVGLPDLGALKSKLFGKRTDLTGGHLARGFPDIAPSGGSPAPAPSISPAPPKTPTPLTSPAPTASPVAAVAARAIKPPERAPQAASAAAAPGEEQKDDGAIEIEVETIETASAASAPATEPDADEPIALVVENEEGDEPATASTAPAERPAAAGDDIGDAAAGLPAELETILAAGAAVDLDKLTLQIPIICLRTWEEQAALDALRPMAGGMKRAFHTWSATRGIVKEDGTVMGEMYCDPVQALEFIRRQKTLGLFVLIDFHNCLGDRKVVRMLREMFEAGETGRGILVLTGPVMPVPPELQPACQSFDWPRGAAVDFDQILNEVRSELSSTGGEPIDLDPEARRLLIDRVRGMAAGRARFEVLCALRGRERSGG